MNKTERRLPRWLWLIIVVGVLLIILAFYFWTPKDSRTVFNLVGILGAFITICGFAITLWQIASLKNTTAATELAITETRNDLKRVSTVAGISQQLTIIRQIKEYVREDKYDIAQLRLYELKDFLSAMEQERGLNLKQEDIKAILRNAKSQLSAVDNKLNNNISINKRIFSTAMEEIASGLVGIKSNL